MTRRMMLRGIHAALVWGKRHFGKARPTTTNPDWLICPPFPVVGVIVHRGAAYDDVREHLHDVADDAVILIKSGDKYTRDCLDTTERKYLQLPSNREYWGDLAAEWRDAEMRLYCDDILEFWPPKPTKSTARKGRRSTGE